jgi:predicted DNA-binding ribbon-helix-helix protein
VYQLVKIKNQKNSFAKMKLMQEADGDYKLFVSTRSGAITQIRISRTFFVDLRHIAAK